MLNGGKLRTLRRELYHIENVVCLISRVVSRQHESGLLIMSENTDGKSALGMMKC